MNSFRKNRNFQNFNIFVKSCQLTKTQIYQVFTKNNFSTTRANMYLPFTFNLGPYGAPWGPKGEQKYLKIRFLRKELIFNLFQKSEMLLKPKYLDFGAMRNLGLLA